MIASPKSRSWSCSESLVEKSIVRREMKSGNAPRYWLLETIRQFGRERLREARRGALASKTVSWHG